MAPATLPDVEEHLKKLVQSLYNLIVQSYDHQGAASQDAMKREITSLITHLQSLSTTAAGLPTTIPPEVIQYIEQGRNPDIYTREFVELVQKWNQKIGGKCEAMALFRDVLAREIVSAMPEVRGEVERVVRATGGKIEG
ncbi:RNA polymerase II mediator complex subunit [Coniosporium apollinis]|uniref:Mediator of RNA polymerase II transcription subunit 10 n=2 Tax=Coniosporium TaxID=2810619 RepID=A0ABQ9P2G3_9PEZI|nr:RNA polymerase II mediator complex subunit [Cladosporium sp. JES 115]KAJ9668208.1 RNA polymerase II mediator complex subunit [Coniosporium apollinis]